MERIQQEIRVLLESSEDSANVLDKLNKELPVIGIQLKIQLIRLSLAKIGVWIQQFQS
jgi:hypothetical protein